MSFDGLVWVETRLTELLDNPVNVGELDAYERQVLLLLEYLWEAKQGPIEQRELIRQWSVFATTGKQRLPRREISLTDLSTRLRAFREQLGI